MFGSIGADRVCDERRESRELMEQTSDRKKLQRIVPRKKNDQSAASLPPAQDSTETTTESTASTCAVATDADFPTLPEHDELESTKSLTRRAARRTKLSSRSADDEEQQKRTVSVRCKNCKTRFQFRTRTDIRYACRECGEMIQVSLQQHKRKWIMLLTAVAVSIVGVVAVVVAMSGSF